MSAIIVCCCTCSSAAQGDAPPSACLQKCAPRLASDPTAGTPPPLDQFRGLGLGGRGHNRRPQNADPARGHHPPACHHGELCVGPGSTDMIDEVPAGLAAPLSWPGPSCSSNHFGIRTSTSINPSGVLLPGSETAPSSSFFTAVDRIPLRID